MVQRWKIINRLIHGSDAQTIKAVNEGEIAIELAEARRIETLRKNLTSRTYLEKYSEIDPESAGPMNGLARCLKAQGEVDEASL